MGEIAGWAALLFIPGYILLVVSLIVGWFKLVLSFPKPNQKLPTVTVVVPVRNEEKNIQSCLYSLVNQNYPPARIEIRIVDDHSSDSTTSIVEQFMEEYSGPIPLYFHSTDDTLKCPPGKKQALQTGINHSKAEWILTTDGDCKSHPDWAKSMLGFLKQRTKMVLGPVVFSRKGVFFERLQAIEFFSLIGFTAASTGLKSPIMANGANLAFNRSAFMDLGGYSSDADLVSGDDVLLLHRMHKKHPEAIQFIPHKEAIVTTDPESSFSSFLQQRIRWASKTKHYQSLQAKITGVFLLAMNVWLMLLILWVLVFPGYFGFLFLIINIKVAVEYVFIFPIAAKFQQKHLLVWLLPLQIFYPFYITFTGLRSIGGSFYWKGRRHRV